MNKKEKDLVNDEVFVLITIANEITDKYDTTSKEITDRCLKAIKDYGDSREKDGREGVLKEIEKEFVIPKAMRKGTVIWVGFTKKEWEVFSNNPFGKSVIIGKTGKEKK